MSSKSIYTFLTQSGKPVPEKISDDYTQYYENYTNKILTAAPTLKLHENQQKWLSHLTDSQIKFITETLQLPELKEKLLSLKVYIYEKEYWPKLIHDLIDSQTIPLTEDALAALGSTTPFGEVYVKGFKIFTLIHERNHAIAHKIFRLKKAAPGKITISSFGAGFYKEEDYRKDGYGAGHMLDEAFTDMLTIDVFKYAGIDDEIFSASSWYLYYDYLLFHLIDLAEERAKLKAKNTLKYEMYKGFLNADYTPLFILDQYIGPDAVKTLSHVNVLTGNTAQQEEEVNSICEKLKVDLASKIIGSVTSIRSKFIKATK
jgi:hypothetical protein